MAKRVSLLSLILFLCLNTHFHSFGLFICRHRFQKNKWHVIVQVTKTKYILDFKIWLSSEVQVQFTLILNTQFVSSSYSLKRFMFV